MACCSRRRPFYLQDLADAGEQFDMVFIDADKNNYINYYNFILDNALLRLDGVICVDNSLFKGRVYLREVEDENAKALRRFNQFVCDDPRVEQVRTSVCLSVSVNNSHSIWLWNKAC